MPMDLFEQHAQKIRKQIAPLAYRLRPTSLDEFVGQEHLLAADHPLHIAIERDAVTSCIFWGPPGCGKTTLAYLIAERTAAHFEPLQLV